MEMLNTETEKLNTKTEARNGLIIKLSSIVLSELSAQGVSIATCVSQWDDQWDVVFKSNNNAVAVTMENEDVAWVQYKMEINSQYDAHRGYLTVERLCEVITSMLKE